MFEIVQPGPKDSMFELKKRADKDVSPEKVDLGVGIYRNELGRCHELRCVTEAKQKLQSLKPDHDYELTVGNPAFLEHASKLVFGEVRRNSFRTKISSVQTISGTGANHLGALFLRNTLGDHLPKIYIGTPTWGNYKPLFHLAGLEVVTYNYYDTTRKAVEFESCLRAVRDAPKNSVFVLQSCCHNPTGADLTKEQWQTLAHEMKLREHLPLLDTAYQGLGRGLDEDAYSIRLFADIGFEMLVCQSFAKNFGLYGERVGALHVLSTEESAAEKVQSRLRNLVRWEYSSAPAFGSRLVNLVLEDEEAAKDWKTEMAEIRTRLHSNRTHLHHLLVDELQVSECCTPRHRPTDHINLTPGNWSHIMRENGLFCFLNITSAQCVSLIDRFHIYLPENGRINIAGLNDSCIERVAQALDTVVQEETRHKRLDARRIE